MGVDTDAAPVESAQKQSVGMIVLPDSATEDQIIGAIDCWISLLESENYIVACESVAAPPGGQWSAELIRSLIKDDWDDAPKDHRVTLAGIPRIPTHSGSGIHIQKKEVSRAKLLDGGEMKVVLYDLNIDGVASDLTALFSLVPVRDGLLLQLGDIRVM